MFNNQLAPMEIRWGRQMIVWEGIKNPKSHLGRDSNTGPMYGECHASCT